MSLRQNQVYLGEEVGRIKLGYERVRGEVVVAVGTVEMCRVFISI